MPDNKFNFTIRSLNKIKPPTKGRDFYTDSTQKGLRLMVTYKGSMSFQLRTWDKNRKKTVTMAVGSYPTMKPDEAREIVVDLNLRIAAGEDVQATREEKAIEETLNALFDRYMTDYAKKEKRSWKDDQSRYELYIQKPLGKKQLSSITESIVENWWKKVKQTPKQRGSGTISAATANRAHALLRTLFSFAGTEPNPVKKIKQNKEDPRERSLQPVEVQRLFQAMAKETQRPDIVDAIQIALFTGARRSNVFRMKWKDIDLDRQIPALDENGKPVAISAPLWTIPAEEAKGGKPQPLPITPDVKEIILRRKKAGKSTVWVFPSPKDARKPVVDIKRPWERLLKAAGIEDLRFHDLRATYATWSASTGASAAVLQKQLGHQSYATTQKYVRLSSEGGVRQAAEQTAGFMKQVAEGNGNGRTEVVPLKK